MPDRKEILAYYKGFEQAMRLHAYKKPYFGNTLYVGGCGPANERLLANELAIMKEAKKLALEQAEKPEPPKFAIIAGEPNSKGMRVANVRSYSDPSKIYRLTFHEPSHRVHCECESYRRLNPNGFALDTDTARLCKHAKDFLGELRQGD